MKFPKLVHGRFIQRDNRFRATVVVDGQESKAHVRHLRELMVLRQKGERAAVVFVVQRADANALMPHQAADPIFAQTLRTAVTAGVEAFAYSCQVTLESIYITREIPVHFSL